MPHDADVLVVGAGPIGLIAANLLADYGCRVILAEKNPTTSDLPRAISATDETLRIMAEIGVLDELAPEMLLNTGARYFGRRDQLLAEVNPGRMVLGQPGKSQFDQPVMEELLYRAAQSRELIDLRMSTEVTQVIDGPDGVRATLVRVGEDPETPEAAEVTEVTEITASWVLAADGGRSPLRTELGIELEGSTQTQKWIVVDVVGSQIKPEAFSEFHCNGRRPVVIVPGVKGRRRYEFMLLPGDDPEQVTSEEFICQLLAPFEPVAPENLRRSAVYVAHQRIAATFRRGHIILIGDAAHLMPPFAGQALNAGARDAANVAWKLAAIVRDGAPEALIDTYEQERRPHAAAMVRLSHLIGKVVMATSGPLLLARDVIVSASRLIPPVYRWITQMRFLKQPHYTHGVLIEPAKGLVGQALPQPQVTLGDAGAAPVPLDTLLGKGWALVRLTGRGRLEVQPLGGEAVSGTYPPAALGEVPPGSTLIVRPDRYVAAITTRAGEATALGALSGLVPSVSHH